MKKKLEGMSVAVMVSDPWEFGTAHGVGPFTAKVVKTGKDESGLLKALLRLDVPIVFEGVRYEFIVAESRAVSHPIEGLAHGSSAFCSMTAISSDQANSSKPLDVSWWRGGGALIGSVEPSASTRQK